MNSYYINISKLNTKKKYKICGFVENIRNKANICFIILKDLTGFLQITIKKNINKNIDKILDEITNQSVIEVEGKLKINKSVKLNGKEFIPSNIKLISQAATPLPIDDTSLIDQRLDYRWIDLRSEKNQLIFRLQTALNQAMREYLIKNNFIEIHSPKLIGAASETGADVFEVSNYFGNKAYLAQSPQFYKQMAISGGFEKVFEVGPVFRAEKSRSNRHGTEFTSFDLEFTNVKTHYDVMKLEEEMLIYSFKKIQKPFNKEVKRLFNTEIIVPKKMPILKINDLYSKLEEKYNFIPTDNDRGDLNSEAEKLVGQYVKEEYNSEFVFVIDYDKKYRPFYHARDEKDMPMGFDLIYRGVEITSGAKRESDLKKLIKNAAEKGLGKDIEFYLQFFKYGCPEHGGFAIGLDRLVMLILGITIKEAELVFRSPDRLNP